MTAIHFAAPVCRRGKITGRNLGDGVLQATERAQLCEVTIPRGTASRARGEATGRGCQGR